MSPNNQDTAEQQAFRIAIDAIRQQAAQHHQREVIVLSGDSDWCTQYASLIVEMADVGIVEWVGKDQDAETTHRQHFDAKLGREVDVLIFPLTPNFDANRLTALCGMIRGGGLLVLLLTKALWNSGSQFDQRFIHALHRPGIHWLQQNKAFNVSPASGSEIGETERLYLQEQAELVEKLIRIGKDNEKAAVVIQSDRGRGKSASLGLAAAKWLAAGESVYLTGPSLKSVAQVFFHSQQALPEATLSRGCLDYQGKHLIFLPPDAVHTEYENIKRLLVDEAAAIPIPKLTDWLKHFPQLVFSTTIHGYEGTGKGFLLKFTRVLDKQRPDWQKFQLQHPIRWASDDLLEQWLNQMFLLDVDIALLDQNRISAIVDSAKAESSIDKNLAKEFLDSGFERDAEIIKSSHHGLSIERYSSHDLANDEHLLQSVYALLINAHYRTTPNDLRYLLDTDAAVLYILWQGQRCLAAAWLMYEGEFDQALTDAVYLGTRRPPGHLLAQSLTYHCAIRDAATYRYARIVRIAVHPQCQRQGLGSQLLQYIIKSESDVDAIGTSFSATPEGLDFWQQNGFIPVRIGMTRHQASGEHSVMLLHPVSEAGQVITDKARARMLDALPYHLQEPLVDLDRELVTRLADNETTINNEISEDDWRELVLFAYANRAYVEALGPLVKLANKIKTNQGLLTDIQETVMVEKIQLHKRWDEVVANSVLDGKNQATQILREAVKRVLQSVAPKGLQDLVNWVTRKTESLKHYR